MINEDNPQSQNLSQEHSSQFQECSALATEKPDSHVATAGSRPKDSEQYGTKPKTAYVNLPETAC